MKQKVQCQDLGSISYEKAWDYQRSLMQQLADIKLQNRTLLAEEKPLIVQKHFLLFCEHPHVYTLGKTGSMEHLLLNEKELEAKKIEFFKINRGGDITYHGPGQIVAYPIFDLDCFFTDLHKYVRFLEEVIIRTLADYGIEGDRVAGFTGVWILPKDGAPKRKICAIGVHMSRWITMHGFAFNVNNDLQYFDYIVPCGIQDDDKTLTSLSKELGYSPDIEEVKNKIKIHFAQLFDCSIMVL